MGVLDKFLNVMKLNDDYDDYDDNDFYDDDDDYDDTPVQKKRGFKKEISTNDLDVPDRPKAAKVLPKVTPMRTSRKTGLGMEVCVVKPTSVEDAREITETLLANRTVVLNLEGLDMDIAQRLIDFTSGATFAISGNLQKISNYIFLITPACVDISGDFQDILNGAFDVPALGKTY